MSKRTKVKQNADSVLLKMRSNVKALLKGLKDYQDLCFINFLLYKRPSHLLAKKPRPVWIRIILAGESKWGRPSWMLEINPTHTNGLYLAVILPMYLGAKPYITTSQLWMRDIKEGEEVFVGYRLAVLKDGIIEEVIEE